MWLWSTINLALEYREIDLYVQFQVVLAFFCHIFLFVVMILSILLCIPTVSLFETSLGLSPTLHAPSALTKSPSNAPNHFRV
jgi:hypothetical protein